MEQKEINRMRIIHAAKILSSLCIAGAVYLLLTGAVPVLSALWKVIAALILVMLICIKLLTFWQAPFDLQAAIDVLFGGDISTQAFGVLSKGVPYVFALTVLFAAGAIVLYLLFDKYKRKGRVISSSVAVAVGIIGMVLVYGIAPYIIESGLIG